MALWMCYDSGEIHQNTAFITRQHCRTSDTRSSSSLLLNIKQMFPAESLHRYARYALSIPPTGKVKQTTLTWKQILGAERNPNSSKDFKTKTGSVYLCVLYKTFGDGSKSLGWLGAVNITQGSTPCSAMLSSSPVALLFLPSSAAIVLETLHNSASKWQ